MTTYNYAWAAAIAALLLVWSCGSDPVELPETTTDFGLNNPTVQEIFDLQDQRNARDLLVFFDHPDATYRYITALALASIQDTTPTVIAALDSATNDPDEAVRYAAIYALGQSQHESAVLPLVRAFKNDLATANNRCNAMVLESIGKCAPAPYLAYLLKPQQYTDQDTLLHEGQTLGVYRFALRGITSSEGTARMIEQASNSRRTTPTRRTAAHYLARARDIDLTLYRDRLLTTLAQEPDAEVRAPLALSFLKVTDEDSTAMRGLKQHWTRETDYRVKINLLRVLERYDYLSVQDVIFAALADTQQHIQYAAADYLTRHAHRPHIDRYFAMAVDDSTRRVDPYLKVKLMGAALSDISYTRAAKRTEINDSLKAVFAQTQDPYLKGEVLRALALFAGNYQLMIDQAADPTLHPYVRSSALEGLIAIRSMAKLPYVFGEYYSGVAFQIKKAIEDAIKSQDIGLISIAAKALQNPAFGYAPTYRFNYQFIAQAQQQLKLPRDMEAYYDLQNTLNLITGIDSIPPPPAYNHPISWSTLKNIDRTTIVTLETTRGNIYLRLFHTLAPGSVANFVQLANKGFFNDKAFHRVVPNFVAQGGCPRGDGYGSLDYTIRSELSTLKYDAPGYVGMASAGKDTEGVQFFITHSATPHLDGRYTIFAQVIDGMDVAHRLRIGDRIKRVTLKNEVTQAEE